MKYPKVDSNQAELVEAFRSRGCIVAHTHMVHKGFPDLVVGYNGRPYLVEVKAPVKGKKTPAQIVFGQSWDGMVHIVRSTDDVASLVSAWEAGVHD